MYLNQEVLPLELCLIMAWHFPPYGNSHNGKTLKHKAAALNPMIEIKSTFLKVLFFFFFLLAGFVLILIVSRKAKQPDDYSVFNRWLILWWILREKSTGFAYVFPGVASGLSEPSLMCSEAQVYSIYLLISNEHILHQPVYIPSWGIYLKHISSANIRLDFSVKQDMHRFSVP